MVPFYSAMTRKPIRTVKPITMMGERFFFSISFRLLVPGKSRSEK
jgi:hypothetical protein